MNAVGAVSLLEGVTGDERRLFQKDDLSGKRPQPNQFGHVVLQLPDGPIVDVFLGSGIVVDIATTGSPIQARNTLREVQVDFKLRRDVVGVVDRALEPGDVLGVNRPSEPVCRLVKLVGRDESGCGKVLKLNGSQARAHPRWSRCKAFGVRPDGVLEYVGPNPRGARGGVGGVAAKFKQGVALGAGQFHGVSVSRREGQAARFARRLCLRVAVRG